MVTLSSLTPLMCREHIWAAGTGTTEMLNLRRLDPDALVELAHKTVGRGQWLDEGDVNGLNKQTVKDQQIATKMKLFLLFFFVA